METATAEPQQSSPVTYPQRIYDDGSGDFVPNVGMKQSSDNLTTVLTDNHEVLGFPDHTSQQEIEDAVNSDKDGSIRQYKPTFYDKFIRQPLAAIGMDAFQPKFVSDIKPSPERAFATSMAEAATANIFKPEFADQEAKAYPVQAFAGGLVGNVAAFTSGSALLDGFKLSQLTPFAENIIKGGILGGVYRGVSETSNQLRDTDHLDLAKIGLGVLHDTLWWGGISGLVGAASKPIGVASAAGLGYLMAKSDGADEPSALLNGAVLGGFHLLQAHGDQQDVRDLVTDKLQKTFSDYILSKNPTVHPIVADLAGREIVSNYAHDVIDRLNQSLEGVETPQAATMEGKTEEFPKTDIETPQAKAIEQDELQSLIKKVNYPEGFKDPYDPKMLDYLSRFIPPNVIVRMEGSERLRMANSSLDELRAYAELHKEAQFDEAQKEYFMRTPQSEIIEQQANKYRSTPFVPIDEAANSQTVLNETMKTITKDVMMKEGEQGQSESKMPLLDSLDADNKRLKVLQVLESKNKDTETNMEIQDEMKRIKERIEDNLKTLEDTVKNVESTFMEGGLPMD